MHKKQKQTIEAFSRVRVFAEANPATGQPGFEPAKAALEEALSRLREFAGAELLGRDLSRAELRRRDQLVERLRSRHMRRIVAIAHAQIEPQSDVRLPAALRMPGSNVGVTKLLHASDTMIEAARKFESIFIANGLPEDFLARFQEARDALEQVVDERTQLVGSHIGARKGLQVQFRRARRAVERLDAAVQEAYEGNEPVLAAWRAAKRLQHRPGGSSPVLTVTTNPTVPNTPTASDERPVVAEMAVAA